MSYNRQHIKQHLRNTELQDTRNYDQEARNLTHKLAKNQKYELLEIVVHKLQVSQSDTRRKELEAIKKAILEDRTLDIYRKQRIVEGYRSEMARNAHPKDGNTRKSPKKV